MLKSFKAVVVAIGMATVLSGAALADTVTFAGTLTGGNEVPPKLTPAKGSATATLDTQTKILTYTVEYSDLTAAPTAAHFHGPADEGANAGVIVKFDSAQSPISGTATLTDDQMSSLMGGKWYANVHSEANPAGEIRGQMVRNN